MTLTAHHRHEFPANMLYPSLSHCQSGNRPARSALTSPIATSKDNQQHSEAGSQANYVMSREPSLSSSPAFYFLPHCLRPCAQDLPLMVLTKWSAPSPCAPLCSPRDRRQIPPPPRSLLRVHSLDPMLHSCSVLGILSLPTRLSHAPWAASVFSSQIRR